MFFRLLRSFGGFNRSDDGIDMVNRLFQSFQDMGPRLRLIEFKAGSPDDDLLSILNEEMEHIFEGEKLWLILVEGQKNDPEGCLHLCMFITRVEEDLRHLV